MDGWVGEDSWLNRILFVDFLVISSKDELDNLCKSSLVIQRANQDIFVFKYSISCSDFVLTCLPQCRRYENDV